MFDAAKMHNGMVFDQMPLWLNWMSPVSISSLNRKKRLIDERCGDRRYISVIIVSFGLLFFQRNN